MRAARHLAADGFAAFLAIGVVGCGGGPDQTQKPTLAVQPPGVDASSPTGADSGGESVADAGGGADAADASTTTSDDGQAGAAVEASSGGPGDASGGDGAVTTGPQSCGFSACATGEPCPDLIVDRDDLLGSILISEQTFSATDCAIVEGCITQTGTRKLLRFDTGTINIGNADLTVGDPTENACFTYSDCHQHYHFRGVGVYTLYQSDGVTVAAVGHKQGFCLEDVEPWYGQTPVAPNPAVPYTCNDQGLHVGWEDVYPNDIDCQWIDITGVPPGNYILSVWINSQHYLPESNYDNNEELVPVTIQ